MPDVCVTVPRNFRWGDKVGLAAWVAEGCLPGEDADDDEYVYSTYGPKPDIQPGERVYIVCQGKLRGYAPLVELMYDRGSVDLIRGGGAVAVTIPEPITGFRGWRYRWWQREDEIPFPNWTEP